jgi:hypothetical protein
VAQPPRKREARQIPGDPAQLLPLRSRVPDAAALLGRGKGGAAQLAAAARVAAERWGFTVAAAGTARQEPT